MGTEIMHSDACRSYHKLSDWLRSYHSLVEVLSIQSYSSAHQLWELELRRFQTSYRKQTIQTGVTGVRLLKGNVKSEIIIQPRSMGLPTDVKTVQMI